MLHFTGVLWGGGGGWRGLEEGKEGRWVCGSETDGCKDGQAWVSSAGLKPEPCGRVGTVKTPWILRSC